MEALIPPVISMTFWLNAKHQGKISDSDFQNACESIVGIALPKPSQRAQCNSTECALDSHRILRQEASGVWSVVARENSLVALDPTSARQALFQELTQATQVLADLATVGQREVLDEQLNSLFTPHLPAIASHHREALDMALRIRLVCLRALEHSTVPSSPSQESALRDQLRHLDDLALSLICAIASNA